MPLRCTRKTLLLAAVISSAAPAFAFAADDAGVRVRLEAQSGDAAVTRKIGIDGVAAAGCLPSVKRVTVDGANLNIELTAATTGCRPQQQISYHIKADPAAAMGLRSLPPAVYRVRVYGGSDNGLLAFSLIDTSARELAPMPESGFWWSQATPEASSAGAGSGMSLEFQDNQLAASLLGFGDTGAATWYFGSGAMAGSIAKISLIQLANGDGWFSSLGVHPDVQSGPRLELEFLSPTRARAYLVRNEDGRDLQVRSLLLTRSVFSAGPAGSAWVGRWVLVPEDGASARVFDFTGPSNRDAESFHLADMANDAHLDCRLVVGTTQPDACTLTALAGPQIDFDQVGLDHLTGHDADGAPVQLMRVPR